MALESTNLYDRTVWAELADDVLGEMDEKVCSHYDQWHLRMRDRLTFLEKYKPSYDECIHNLELLIDMHDWHSTYKEEFQSRSDKWVGFLFADEWVRTPPDLIRHPVTLENAEEWCIWNGWWDDSEEVITFLYPH
jgi:hypothetical protein